jgi:hypothetical protein
MGFGDGRSYRFSVSARPPPRCGSTDTQWLSGKFRSLEDRCRCSCLGAVQTRYRSHHRDAQSSEVTILITRFNAIRCFTTITVRNKWLATRVNLSPPGRPQVNRREPYCRKVGRPCISPRCLEPFEAHTLGLLEAQPHCRRAFAFGAVSHVTARAGLAGGLSVGANRRRPPSCNRAAQIALSSSTVLSSLTVNGARPVLEDRETLDGSTKSRPSNCKSQALGRGTGSAPACLNPTRVRGHGRGFHLLRTSRALIVVGYASHFSGRRFSRRHWIGLCRACRRRQTDRPVGPRLAISFAVIYSLIAPGSGTCASRITRRSARQGIAGPIEILHGRGRASPLVNLTLNSASWLHKFLVVGAKLWKAIRI